MNEKHITCFLGSKEHKSARDGPYQVSVRARSLPGKNFDWTGKVVRVNKYSERVKLTPVPRSASWQLLGINDQSKGTVAIRTLDNVYPVRLGTLGTVNSPTFYLQSPA